MISTEDILRFIDTAIAAKSFTQHCQNNAQAQRLRQQLYSWRRKQLNFEYTPVERKRDLVMLTFKVDGSKLIITHTNFDQPKENTEPKDETENETETEETKPEPSLS